MGRTRHRRIRHSHFRAAVSWEGSNTDALWGPSIHWNTHLNNYVAVLNRSCCKSGWPQEGIYLSVSGDLGSPQSWSPPVKIMDAKTIGFAPGYYPQVVGIDEGGTDSLAGGTARLFIKGISKWEIVFLTVDEAPVEPPEPKGPPVEPPDLPILDLLAPPPSNMPLRVRSAGRSRRFACRCSVAPQLRLVMNAVGIRVAEINRVRVSRRRRAHTELGTFILAQPQLQHQVR